MPQVKVVLSVGTRPEIIKTQPIVKELRDRTNFELLYVHTGQHYDSNMSDLFFKELDLIAPNIFLKVNRSTPCVQLARILSRFEHILKESKAHIVLVQGDTNTALGCALAASKLKIPVGHIEAGCRSFDLTMPEEINRAIIADLATFHFAPTQNCINNLLQERILKKHIYYTGHPILDLLFHLKNNISSNAVKKRGLAEKSYIYVTIHREENINERSNLNNVLNILTKLNCIYPIIFPMHPHTRKNASRFKLLQYFNKLNVIDPIGYLESLSFIKNAKIVLTDSGGIQQEAALLKTPCITLRNNTEWVETVNRGVNFLAKTEEEIFFLIHKIEQDKNMKRNFSQIENIFGGLGASKKIVDILESKFM